VLDIDGDLMPESEVIAEYLEEIYPQPRLLGDTPRETAHIRTLARIGDVYLACGSRSLALVDVAVSGKKVKLLGAAKSALIGQKVELRKVGAKKVVARATVGKDGLFSATAT